MVADETGSRITDLRFDHLETYPHKPAITGLPSARWDEQTRTWAFVLKDDQLHLQVTLVISADETSAQPCKLNGYPCVYGTDARQAQRSCI